MANLPSPWRESYCICQSHGKYTAIGFCRSCLMFALNLQLHKLVLHMWTSTILTAIMPIALHRSSKITKFPF